MKAGCLGTAETSLSGFNRPTEVPAAKPLPAHCQDSIYMTSAAASKRDFWESTYVWETTDVGVCFQTLIK